MFHIHKIAWKLPILFVLWWMAPSPSAWSGDWQMSFTVSVPDSNTEGGLLTNRLEAGEQSTATDLYDNALDVVAFPSGPVQAAFTHEGETTYPGSLQLLWRDIREDGIPKSWTLKVSSRQSGAPITVAWTNPPSISSDACDSVEVEFQDQTTGQAIDLDSSSRYAYDSTGSVSSPEIRYFTLTISRIPQNAPAAPTGLRVGQPGFFHHRFIRLQWEPDPPTNLAGYYVWRSTTNGSGYVRINAAPSLKNWYLDKQVRTGETYYYVVTAVGTNGCESPISQQTTASVGLPKLR